MLSQELVKPVILVVDDNPMNLQVLLESLKQTGFKILVARSGESAIQQAEYGKPDLILLDVMMPGMDGFETCRRMKTREALKDTPVIFMTALTEISDKVKGFQAGGVDYVTKPLHHEEVLARVRTHLTMRRLQQQLQEQHLLLQEKHAQLQALNASKDKFFSIISHDLRSPLSAVITGLRMLTDSKNELSDSEQHEIICDARDTTERLYALLENLLTWSRLQRGLIEFAPRPLDVRPLLEQNVKLFAATAAQKQIAIRQTATEPILIYADRPMIDAVIRNLLSNALKFTAAHGSITLSAAQQDDAIEVAIADTGIGMSAETLARLFRLDVRYDQPGTAGEKGTGLGLNVCKEFIEKNGGSISVESVPGAGTTFRMRFPKHCGDHESMAVIPA
ncbi:response regulator receiver sensor signal transduction histidine kinase [Candidatus Moduliflexus flocculans]|uniref:histidine kinase n=1 Tax=Candidatus Moduliflexus flocculans TaxID=1499966 RepID=A0A081BN28_9BACT|nr:response regulator receiver sensor signal transduction histidine kinase [Candidatus Moduliflexus flocculans]